MSRAPDPDRLLELLADRATRDLSPQDERDLRELLAGETDESMDRAAAAAAVVFAAGDPEAMPESLRRRLQVAASAREVGGSEARAGRARSVAIVQWAGWAVAAAVALAAILWPRGAAPIPIEKQYRQMASMPGVIHAEWTDWQDPEQKGVTGEVCWDEARQSGFMLLRGLKPNDPAVEQYQLWIIDSRGLADPVTNQSARISGAVFDATTGETIVPIQPAIAVQGAAAFAVTIEKPRGTWVSDMSRRVVIASVKKG